MKNSSEEKENYDRLLDEYKILREDKNHHDRLIWQILYFYFAIAPLFLLVGSGLTQNYPNAMLYCIAADIMLGLYTLYALLRHRSFWYYDVSQIKELISKPFYISPS